MISFLEKGRLFGVQVDVPKEPKYLEEGSFKGFYKGSIIELYNTIRDL